MRKKLEEIRSKSKVELEKEIIKVRKEIAKLKFKGSEENKDTNLVGKKRKYLARLLTALTEKGKSKKGKSK